MTDEFPDNSHAAREKEEPSSELAPVRQRKFEKVVTGTAVKRKKSLFMRFSDTFLDGASFQDIMVNVVKDIAIPAAKDLIYDSFTTGLHKTLHGDEAPPSRSRRGSSSTRRDGPYTPYSRSNRGRRDDPRDRDRERSGSYRPMRDWEDVVVDTRAEADAVIDEMYKALRKFHQVTVLDLYDMVDMNSSFTDEMWGWRDLEDAHPRRLPGGQYMIALPVPIELRE